MSHAVVVPVVLPMLTAIALLLLSGRGLAVQRPVSLLGLLALTGVTIALAIQAGGGAVHAYGLGNWPAPFGIVLVLDRLSALMLLLTAVVALFAMAHAVHGVDGEGAHFHALFHLQLAGLNGAFLTGDLFNLFVFFEILLIASYCLLIHGARTPRLTAGVHYVVINLAGSALFLIGIGVMYGTTGTLNMADMAVRVAALPAADAALIRAGALLLLVVFAVKAALVPLYFWLPSAYASTSAPVAALFAIMTKVGVYAIVRIFTLVFGDSGGVAAHVATPWLLPAALVTVALGMLGALGSAELRRMQGYFLIASIGIMLAAIGLFDTASIAAGLYYMVHSTLTMAAMFLLADLIARQRGDRDDLLVPSPAVAQPAPLGVMFFIGAVAIAGLPPLSGFLGKVLILGAAPFDARGWWVWSVVLGGGLVAMIALSRAGSMIFWKPAEAPLDGGVADVAEPVRGARHSGAVMLPAAALLASVIALTVFAGPAESYLRATAAQLTTPTQYVTTVLDGLGLREAGPDTPANRLRRGGAVTTTQPTRGAE
jgi:multicomponent K+:H+ antiporter subunit D